MNTILKYVFYAVIIVIIYLVGRGIYESNVSKQNSDAQTIDRINPNVQSRASDNQKTGQNDQQGELKMSQNDLNNDVWEKTKETSNDAWEATKEGSAKAGTKPKKSAAMPGKLPKKEPLKSAMLFPIPQTKPLHRQTPRPTIPKPETVPPNRKTAHTKRGGGFSLTLKIKKAVEESQQPFNSISLRNETKQ